jgi:hypothetical protein
MSLSTADMAPAQDAAAMMFERRIALLSDQVAAQQDENERLKAERDRLKADNARLQAALDSAASNTIKVPALNILVSVIDERAAILVTNAETGQVVHRGRL